MKKILMIGPDLMVRGGTPAVEKVLLDNLRISEQMSIEFIPAHRDLSKIGKLLFAGQSFLKFLLWMMTKRIDVVYIHMSADSSFFRKSLFMMAGYVFRKKIVIHMHGGYFEDFYKNSGRLIKRYIEFILNLADEIIVLTLEWKRFYQTMVKKDNITVVHNSVVVDKNKYNSGGKLITFLGRLNRKKGAYDVLDIAGEVIKKYPGMKFVLAGDGEIEKIRQTAFEKGLTDHIMVPGWISKKEIEEILAQTVIYVLPSYAEGLPMSVLEAMAFGIPVISTDVGGLHEVITSEENGILIKAGDQRTLRDSILRLLEQRELRLKFSRKGHQRVDSRFNAKLFVQKVSDVLLR